MFSTQRRRSHTFTEGTFDGIARQVRNRLSPNDLVRQRSAGSPETKRIDDRSPILQTLHRKFLSQGDSDANYAHSDGEYEQRQRSASSLDRFIKREDNLEFEIPCLTPPRSPIMSMTPPGLRSSGGSHGSSSIDLGEFNPDLYRNVSSSISSDDEAEEIPYHEKLRTASSIGDTKSNCLNSMFERVKSFDAEPTVKDDSVGTITLSFRYVAKEHNLLIKLIDVSLNFQPSPCVRESQWTIDPLLVIDVLREARSPTGSKKIGVSFHKHHSNVMKKEDTCKISVKNKTKDAHIIKIVLYNEDVVNKDLAIGAVHFNLLNVLSSDGSEKIFSRRLVMFHELYNKPEGVITSILQWNSQDRSFRIHIQTIKYSKEFHHMKELFVKANVYVGHAEYLEHKTDLLPASQEMTINETFDIDITSDKVRNMYILLQVFEKHLLGSISLHRAVIGPYMKPTLKQGTVSCWEKAILSPGEEITCTCDLYF